jgi:hypothetical protein
MVRKRIRLALAGFTSALVLAFGGAGMVAAIQTDNPGNNDDVNTNQPNDNNNNEDNNGNDNKDNEDHKVTICHRTDAVNNPYVKITVDADAADGNTGNDNGQGDHSTHTGPIATSEAVAQQLKDNHQMWGDIIPPHDNFAGLNWTAQGQAIFNNNCNFVTPGQGGGETPTPPPTTTTTTTPTTPGRGAAVAQAPTPTPTVTQVIQTPVGGVGAGLGGGSVQYSTASLIGMGGSLATLMSGLVWLSRRKSLSLT